MKSQICVIVACFLASAILTACSVNSKLDKNFLITDGQVAIYASNSYKRCISNMTSDTGLGKIRRFPSIKIDEDIQVLITKKFGRLGYEFCDPPSAQENNSSVNAQAPTLYLGNIRTDGLGYFYVSRGYVCGSLCGDGSIKVFSKINGSWKINGDNFLSWIS